MAQFNLDDYETVEERLKRFHVANPDGRIITTLVDVAQVDGHPYRWVVRTEVYLTGDDQVNGLVKASGYAMEVESGKQAQWSLELAETSSIGRALANMNMSGNKRASREEMSKVAAAEKPARNWLNDADILHFAKDKKGLQSLYLEAKTANVSGDVLAKIVEYGQSLA